MNKAAVLTGAIGAVTIIGIVSYYQPRLRFAKEVNLVLKYNATSLVDGFNEIMDDLPEPALDKVIARFENDEEFMNIIGRNMGSL